MAVGERPRSEGQKPLPVLPDRVRAGRADQMRNAKFGVRKRSFRTGFEPMGVKLRNKTNFSAKNPMKVGQCPKKQTQSNPF
jgi:hypothetical protein